MEVLVLELISATGTVWVFEGIDPETGDGVRFGADHRMGQAIYEGLSADEDDVVAEVPDYLVLQVFPIEHLLTNE